MRAQVSISTPYTMEHNPKLAAKQRNLFNCLLLAYLVKLPLATIIFINQYSMVTYEMSCLSVISNAYGTWKSLYSAATIGFLVIANLVRHQSAVRHCPVQTEQTAAMATLDKPLHREFEYYNPSMNFKIPHTMLVGWWCLRLLYCKKTHISGFKYENSYNVKTEEYQNRRA